jgi:hypothetical protein
VNDPSWYATGNSLSAAEVDDVRFDHLKNLETMTAHQVGIDEFDHLHVLNELPVGRKIPALLRRENAPPSIGVPTQDVSNSVYESRDLVGSNE